MNTLSELYCDRCESTYDPKDVQTFCVECQSPLFARYDLNQAREKLSKEIVTHRPRGMWRWRELLPVVHAENMLTLGEGDA